MFDIRLGRLLGFLVGIGLLVAAVVLYRSHRMDEKKIEVVQYDNEAARQAYEERIEQTKVIMSGLGGK
ncbi:MAG: hypothetical protein K6T77_02570 [candidate division WOR-3 bacterium]|jgi:predicted histidine transporter YuiF (NhaC family)|nr:hypothetical protein [candidate division WOR-3 bacterium]MCR4423852.1 hypothetical protein [candidate division WOR-3 bacterium]MDH7519190.1 hypothetical protein [bacterium]